MSGDLYKLNLAFFTVFGQQNYAVLLSESKKLVPWLLSVVLFCVSLRLVILLQHRLVTDGQTDRQAHRLRSQPRRKCIPELSTYRIRTRMPFVTEIRR